MGRQHHDVVTPQPRPPVHQVEIRAAGHRLCAAARELEPLHPAVGVRPGRVPLVPAGEHAVPLPCPRVYCVAVQIERDMDRTKYQDKFVMLCQNTQSNVTIRLYIYIYNSHAAFGSLWQLSTCQCHQSSWNLDC